MPTLECRSRPLRQQQLGSLGCVVILGLLGCQPCLEFECGEGGFVWLGESTNELLGGRYALEASTPLASYRFDCELPDTPADDDVLDCGPPVVSGDPAGEVAEATVTLRSGGAIFSVRVRRPNDEPSQEGDLGPDTITIHLSAGEQILFEEDYEPEYLVQSKGRGCGSCVHEVYERAVVSE